MSQEVGNGQVAIFPTFKGFRKAVAAEVDATTAAAGKGAASALTAAGRSAGQGFGATFSTEARKSLAQVTRDLRTEVARGSRAYSAARLKEQDAAGKVRVAEAALSDARRASTTNTARAIAAEERLASAQRSLAALQAVTRDSSSNLTAARAKLADAEKQASAASRELSSSMGSARTAARGLASDTASAGRSILSQYVNPVTVGVTALGTALVKGFNRWTAIDSATARLDAFGLSARNVDEVLAIANRSALGTAYSLDQLATAATAALATGVEQSALEKYLGRITDVAAAAQTDLGGISLVFNQIQAAGRLYTQDANQLVQRGISVWALLAERYGVTATQLRKMVEQGKVDANTFFDVIDERYAGTAKNIKSFDANWANFMAAVGRRGADLVGGGLTESKDLLKDLTQIVDDLAPLTQLLGDVLGFTVSVFSLAPASILSTAAALVVLNKLKTASWFAGAISGARGFSTQLRTVRAEAATTGAVIAAQEGRFSTFAASARSILGALAISATAPASGPDAIRDAAERMFREKTAERLDQVSGSVDRLNGALAASGRISPVATVLTRTGAAVSTLNAALVASGVITADAATAADGATSSYDSLGDAAEAAFARMSNASAVNEALNAVGQSIENNGRRINTFTEGGRANLSAVRDALDAIAADAGDNANRYGANVVAFMQSLDRQGIDTTSIMGMVRDSLVNVSAPRWAVLLDGSQAIAEAKAVAAAAFAAAKILAITASGPDAVVAAAKVAAAAAQIMSLNAVQSQADRYARQYAAGVNSAAAANAAAGSSASKAAKDITTLGDVMRAVAAIGGGKQSLYTDAALSALDVIRDAYKDGSLSKRERDRAIQGVKAGDLLLQENAKRQEQLAGYLADAQSKLADAISARDDYRRAIREGYANLADLSRLAQDSQVTITRYQRVGDVLVATQQSSASAESVLEKLRNQVEEAKKFRAAYDELSKAGLNDASLQNLISDFMSTGSSALADSLAGSGAATVSEINDLTKQLNGAGSKLGKDASQQFYGAGVETARGLVAGIESQIKAAEAAADRIAKAMLKQMKKTLGINSPSKKAELEVGRQIPAGVIRGVQSMAGRVRAALNDMVALPSVSVGDSAVRATVQGRAGTQVTVHQTNNYAYSENDAETRNTALRLVGAVHGLG